VEFRNIQIQTQLILVLDLLYLIFNNLQNEKKLIYRNEMNMYIFSK